MRDAFAAPEATPPGVFMLFRMVQYGGALRARCNRAASVHQARSSAKRGKLRASRAPSSPIGMPSAFRPRSMGPTLNVLEMTTMPISLSVPCQRKFARALRSGRFAPPSEIVGKARKTPRQPGAILAHRHSVCIQAKIDGADGQRTRNDHHAHFAQRSMPEEIGARSGEAPTRVTDHGGRPPKPFLEEMVGEILESGLHAPVVFTGNEHERIG